jgi:hypothetical protein
MRTLRVTATAASVALLAAGIATAATLETPPISKRFKSPERSPVAFAKVPSAQGFSRALAKGTVLKAGQTIELVIGKGNVVVAPGDCSCQGSGWCSPRARG